MDVSKNYVWEFPPIDFVPQTAEDIAFGVEDLKAGCSAGVDQKLREWESELLVKKSYLVSSEFTLWKCESAERKESFVVNFSMQSNFWEKEFMKMERMD